MSLSSNNDLSTGHSLPLMEDFFTIQGEGFHTGKAAYFIRVGGCDVGCSWCDVKESWDADTWPLTPAGEIVERAVASGCGSIVVTGGEPLMYNMDFLCSRLKENKFTIYLETSGSHSFSGRWDWICLSPKKYRPPLSEAYMKADELKVIISNNGDFDWAEKNAERVHKYCHLFLQPEWSKRNIMLPEIVDYVQKNTKWRISLQAHKYIGIP